jgi:hypothetical protein
VDLQADGVKGRVVAALDAPQDLHDLLHLGALDLPTHKPEGGDEGISGKTLGRSEEFFTMQRNCVWFCVLSTM